MSCIFVPLAEVSFNIQYNRFYDFDNVFIVNCVRENGLACMYFSFY